MSKIGEFVTKHPILTYFLASSAINAVKTVSDNIQANYYAAKQNMPIVRNRNAIYYDSGKISMHYDSDDMTKTIEGGVDTLKEALKETINDTTEEEETTNE